MTIMSDSVRSGDETSIATTLRRLADENAPDTIRSRVLTRLDLADEYMAMNTIAGDVYIAYNRRGVTYVDLVSRSPNFEDDYEKRFQRPVFPAETPPTKLVEQVKGKLAGTVRVGPRYDLSHVTAFEREVLLKALEIPFGQVRPYNWIAKEIGRPQAQRAVGSALAGNPIPLLIPCHRVVRSDGIIGNYGLGGPTVKRRVLEAEGARPDDLERLARAGFRYVGSDTTHIVCFPTCGHARRVTDSHLVRFPSLNAAFAAGYRPCKVCRPATEEEAQSKAGLSVQTSMSLH